MARAPMKFGATPGKLALVAVLAVVLIVVVVVQFKGPSEPPLVATRRPTRPQVNQQATAKQPTSLDETPTVQTASVRSVPMMSLADVGAFDPFSWPRRYRPSARQTAAATSVTKHAPQELAQQARRAQALEELKKHQVSAIFHSGEDRVAVVGHLTLRVGDLFHGFRVTAIDADGIKLEEPRENGR